MKKIHGLFLFFACLPLTVAAIPQADQELASLVVNTLKVYSYTPVNEELLMSSDSIEGLLRRYLGPNSPRKLMYPSTESPYDAQRKIGLGITLRTIKRNKNVVGYSIGEIFPDSAAQKAGLQLGDKLLAIDSELVSQLGDVKQVAEKLQGLENTNVTLKLMRGSDVKTIVVTRKSIFAPRFTTTIREDIGIIGVRSLLKEFTANDFNQALTDLENHNINVIVIDFSVNEQADLLSGLRFMEQLVPNDTPLFLCKGKNGDESFKTNNERTAKRAGKFFVLQSAHAGGMPEILARLMKKHLGAQIIGERSQGFALLSSLVPLGNGSSIIVRTSEFTDLDGTPWHRQPIEPDFFLPVDQFDNVISLKRFVHLPTIPSQQMSKL